MFKQEAIQKDAKNIFADLWKDQAFQQYMGAIKSGAVVAGDDIASAAKNVFHQTPDAYAAAMKGTIDLFIC